MQIDLFNPDEAKRPPPEPGKRCRNCIHMYHHQYNSSMKYCKKQFDKKTTYGNKKIKANDPACHMFESNADKK